MKSQPARVKKNSHLSTHLLIDLFSFNWLPSLFRCSHTGLEHDTDDVLRKRVHEWAEHFKAPEDGWERILRRLEQGRSGGPPDR